MAGTDDESGGLTFEEEFSQVQNLIEQSQFLSAHELASQLGLYDFTAADDGLLWAGRLAGHLGSRKMYYELTERAYRHHKQLARFQTQRIYTLMEKRGIISAWEASLALKEAQAESDKERAEALTCQGRLAVMFRDFAVARDAFTRAQALEPQSPWVWSESSSLSLENGDTLLSLEHLDYALHLQPYFRPALLRKVECLQSLQRDEEALVLLQDGCHRLQSYAVACQLALVFSEQEQWQKLLETVETAERLAPLADEKFQQWLVARRVDAYSGLGDVDKAVVQARQLPENEFYKRLADRLAFDSSTSHRVKIAVPFIKQDYNTCAPATLSAITTFWNQPIAQDILIEAICYDGTYDFSERRWAEKAGWYVREFKVTWESATALLDRGIPFILSTTEIDSGHAQAVIGYDVRRRSLLIRDPSLRHYTETAYDEFAKHYASVGPRGFLVLPQDKVGELEGVELPESDLYDHYFHFNCALDGHDREQALHALSELERAAPNHRLLWTGKSALASYDQNLPALLEAIEGFTALYPDDDRILRARINGLRSLGRMQEVRNTLQQRCRDGKKVHPFFWREYALSFDDDARFSHLALRLARRALRDIPFNVDNLSALAGLLWKGLHRGKALELQRLAVCLGDKREDVTYTFFQMQACLGQAEEVLDFLRERSEALLQKSTAPAITWLRCLDQLDRFHDVEAGLPDLLAKKPNDGELLLYAAMYAARRAQHEESSRCLLRAKPVSNKTHWLTTAAQLASFRGESDQSLKLWVQLTERSPLNVEAHRQIALLIARNDGKAAAQDYVRSIGRRFPHHCDLLKLEVDWLNGDRDQDAESRVGEFLTLNPQFAWALRQRALFLLRRRELDSALELAQNACTLDPQNAESWQVKAQVLEQFGRRSEAREDLRHAIELYPDSEYAIRTLFAWSGTSAEKEESLRFMRQQLKRPIVQGPAISIFREVAFPLVDISQLAHEMRELCEQRPDRWESWLAWILQSLIDGDTAMALQAATQAVERFPLIPNAWYYLARVQRQMERWPEAIESTQTALRLNPEWQPSLFELTELYRSADRTDDARNLLEQAHQRNPLDVIILANLADLLWRQDQQEVAIRYLLRAVELNPDYDWAWNCLAERSELFHKKNLALEEAKSRAERLPQDASAWIRVAKLLTKPGFTAEQLQAALNARQYAPRNVEAHDLVATFMAFQRRYHEAHQACHPEVFQQSLPSVLRGRDAWITAIEGKITHAIEAFKTLLKDDPQYYWGWDVLADLQIRGQHFHQALESSEQLIRLAPIAAAPYLKRAEIQIGLSRPDEAMKDYARALALEPSALRAGWKLFSLQVTQKRLTAAAHTLDLMRGNAPKCVTAHGQIILLAQDGKLDEALSLFNESAFLLEIDSNTLMDAANALIPKKALLKKNIESLLTEQGVNPILAELWVLLFGESQQWDLIKIFDKIPNDSALRDSFVQRWLQMAAETNQALKTAQSIRNTCPEITARNTLAWAIIGQIYLTNNAFTQVIEWMRDWESRPDLQGWMVTNLVFALQLQNRTQEADEISRKILERGLRDHSTGEHIGYLMVSALESGNIEEARTLLQDLTFDDESAPVAFFLRALYTETLHVVEQPDGKQRNTIYREALKRLYQIKQNKTYPSRLISIENRCTALMLGKPSPALEVPMARSVNPSREKSSVNARSEKEDLKQYVRIGAWVLGGFIALVFVIPVIVVFYMELTDVSPTNTPHSLPPSAPVQTSVPPAITTSPLPQSPLVPPASESATSPAPKEAIELFERGRFLLSQGKTDEALQLLTQAHQKRPKDMLTWLELTRTYSSLGQHQEAVGQGEQAAQTNPKNDLAWALYGEALLRADRLTEAEKACRTSIELNPNNHFAWYGLGYCQARNRLLEQACDSFTKAVRAMPASPEAWFMLSRCYLDSRELLDGEMRFKELLQQYPSSGAGWTGLGAIQAQAGMVETALTTYQKALTIQPLPDTHNAIGLIYAMKQQTDEAIDSFNKALRLNPNFVESLNNLGYTYFLKGNLGEAQKMFERAITLNPTHINALVNLTRCYAKQGHSELAIQTCLKIEPLNSDLANRLRVEITAR